MKMFFRLLVIFSVFFVSNAWSDSKAHEHKHDHKHDHGEHHHESSADKSTSVLSGKCEDMIYVKVNGLVCDFCARALEKVFGKNKDVKGINVDLDKGVIEIEMVAGKSIDDKILNKSITDSGYNLVEINRGCS